MVPGHVKQPTDREMIDPIVEDALEIYRPNGKLRRVESVYASPTLDFSRFGLKKPGYIYRVKIVEPFDCRDVCWLKPMQLALLQENQKEQFPETYRINRKWSESLAKYYCEKYWSGFLTDRPILEIVTNHFKIEERLSECLVEPAETKGGWHSRES